MKLPTAISPAEAEARGMRVLSGPYNFGDEDQTQLMRAISSLGKIPWATVKAPGGGLEIWRSRAGWFGSAF